MPSPFVQDYDPDDYTVAELEAARRSLSETLSLRDQLSAKVNVIIHLSGGVVQGATADTESVAVTVLDYEVDGEAPENMILTPDGDEAWRYSEVAVFDVDYVQTVLDASSLED